MIHIEEEDSRIEGMPNILLAEITIAVSHVVGEVSKRTEVCESDILDQILDALKIEKLLKSGMSYEEAVDVLGIGGHDD